MPLSAIAFFLYLIPRNQTIILHKMSYHHIHAEIILKSLHDKARRSLLILLFYVPFSATIPPYNDNEEQIRSRNVSHSLH